MIQKDEEKEFLKEVIKLYANRPEAQVLEQKGNFGIGHMSGGNIESGVEIAGIINEVQQQEIAVAAEKVQNLLKQLEDSYPTNTDEGKIALADKVIEKIKNDPTLTQQIFSILKSAGY